jgi:aminopeptidase N
MIFGHTVAKRRVGFCRITLLCVVLSFFPGNVMSSPLSDPVVPEPGVSLPLARERAANIQDLRYDLFFDVPETAGTPIPAQLELSFLLKKAALLVLDFKAPEGHLGRVQANGREVAAVFQNGHILIPGRYLRKGPNQIDIAFTAGDLSLNRNEDYLYTLLVPDRASTTFPCFDQPDIKARYRLRLGLPTAWEASANGALEQVQVLDGRKTYTFRETLPFSTYLFAFAAGRFGKRTQAREGREMTMYFRETDQAKVDRNADAVFDLHAEAIRWLEAYTDIPFPFDKLDFVLLPGFQYGGMEHVGNIFYREPALLLDESATDNQKLARARLIAHETAHMWFGDLVTMRWFNDVWLKEVFANFMAAKAVNPSFPDIHHDLSFLLGHQPVAYSEDRSGGSHPIQQELENLKDAGSLYGGIIYQKAPVVMRQLEALIGADRFRQGIREYLRRFSYKNATWDDLIGIFDELSPLDVRTWSQVWVKEAGMPVLRTEWTSEDHLRILQENTSKSGTYWAQSTAVALFYPDGVRLLPCRIEGAVTELPLPAGQGRPLAVLCNGTAMSYGYFKLDGASQAYLLENAGTLADPLLRGAAWMALYEELVHDHIPPRVFWSSVLAALPNEKEPLNRQNLLGYLGNLYWRYLGPEERQAVGPEAEALLWELLLKAENTSAKAAYFSAYTNLAQTQQAVGQLYAVWEGKSPLPGLPLSESQKIGLAGELALRLPGQAEEIIAIQLERTANPDRLKRLAFVRPALSPLRTVRDSFFQSLQQPANRAVEPWVVEAVEYLNHPLRAGSSEAYILPSLELLEEIQRTGDIFFPRQFISAVLGGHRSREAADTVRRFLETHPAFPYRLRNKTLMAADMLFRVAR